MNPCPHNSSPCAGPFTPYTRADPTGAPAFLAHLARPHSPALVVSAPAPSSPRRHAAIAAVASPAIGASACSPSARFHTRNATTASAALTPPAGYRTAALAPTSSSRARQRPRHHHYLSPFPSFSFARNSRARKQRVFELPPCSSAPISGGCVGLWYTLAPELFAALSRTFRRRQQRLYPRSCFGLRRSTSASRRAPALGRWVCPCPPQLFVVRRPSRASHPPRSRRRPRIASSQRVRPARVLLLWLPRPQHRCHHAACCLTIKSSRIFAHRLSCTREFWCCALASASLSASATARGTTCVPQCLDLCVHMAACVTKQ